MSYPTQQETLNPAYLSPTLQALFMEFKERRDSLERYVESGKAKRAYVDRENRLLQTVAEVLTELSTLRHLELWLAVEAKMKQLKQHDPTIDGWVMHLDECERPKRPAMIHGSISF